MSADEGDSHPRHWVRDEDTCTACNEPIESFELAHMAQMPLSEGSDVTYFLRSHCVEVSTTRPELVHEAVSLRLVHGFKIQLEKLELKVENEK